MRVAPVLQGIIAGMKQFDDEGAQLSSLSELCELLSISTEESLTTFPIEQVVPLLVSAAAQLYLKAEDCRAVHCRCMHAIHDMFCKPRSSCSGWYSCCPLHKSA
jgi:E3 ubiquitin-protein ligase TRIP12